MSETEEKKEQKFLITESLMNEILNVLGQLPYVKVSELIKKIGPPNLVSVTISEPPKAEEAVVPEVVDNGQS